VDDHSSTLWSKVKSWRHLKGFPFCAWLLFSFKRTITPFFNDSLIIIPDTKIVVNNFLASNSLFLNSDLNNIASIELHVNVLFHLTRLSSFMRRK
ncbi:hypothetical protein, partial [Pullulanibacillus camelliae]|uniref:hypothetical protein n=1 Tax=Pullulanibacillus camelliae TaxID=1707096 RepID=UPI001E33AFF4